MPRSSKEAIDVQTKPILSFQKVSNAILWLNGRNGGDPIQIRVRVFFVDIV